MEITLKSKVAQQSVHPTLGILARFQAFFYASAFSQSDGVPPPAPARVTQTVSWLLPDRGMKMIESESGFPQLKVTRKTGDEQFYQNGKSLLTCH